MKSLKKANKEITELFREFTKLFPYSYTPYLEEINLYLQGVGIYIQLSEEFYTTGVNHLWQVLVYDPDNVDSNCILSNGSSGVYGDNGEYETREDALGDAVKYSLLVLLNRKDEFIPSYFKKENEK